MIKEDIDRLHEILKRSIVIILLLILRPNELEFLDLRAILITSERSFLH